MPVKQIAMKHFLLSCSLACLPSLLPAQFEQKVSLNFEAGVFKTVGPKTYQPSWSFNPDEFPPTQMPNYKPGPMVVAGLQFNLNRNLSLKADIGIMYTGKWFYPADPNSPEYARVNHLEYFIYDQVTDELITQGSDQLNVTNICIGFAPKYYLSPGKKINPYFYAGIALSYLSSSFEDNQWEAYRDLGLLPIDDTGPGNPYLEKSAGFGFKPGFGMEYALSDKAGFFLSTGFYYILLNKDNFKTEEQAENFMTFTLQAGLRFSFIKSKQL